MKETSEKRCEEDQGQKSEEATNLNLAVGSQVVTLLLTKGLSLELLKL